tara:strand:+ start:645 stop:857 length:213 start_codon:yes stop_codon:yes gene_type:complete
MTVNESNRGGCHVSQARIYLGGSDKPISQGTLYKLLKGGEIESYKVGARRYITYDEMDRYIESVTEVGAW